jgi:hypothetical protein
MAIYNILTENSQVKGRIGEVIASHYLRKQGFIVNRPSRILRQLGRAGVPNNYEVQFLRRYRKTMDYFAVYPRDDPLLIRREAVCEVFAQGGLDRYSTPLKSKGYVVEVKTNHNAKHPSVSKRQKRMFSHARKLGFKVILIIVTFRENYTAEITLLEEEGVKFTTSKEKPLKR